MMASALYHLAALLTLSTEIYAYGITGISGGVNYDTGERPARRDLRDLQSSGAAFDLYIQALAQFQSDDQSDFVSYYEIAGIHGYPYQSWDGVEGQFITGYCSHGSPIFPTWHRPYLALFEQRIWQFAQSIANAYPEDQRQTYIDAADTLRIPYWDWAVNPNMPESLVYQSIVINTPNGQRTMDNPLYSYKFHPLPLGSDIPNDDPLAKYSETVRSPDPNTGQSRMDKVNSGMSSNSAWLTSSTYQLLSSETNYTVFSNSVLQDRGDNYNNLESIHDGVHALVGDGGHMTYFSMAAFDPIFWIHHCSIDRIFALWEVLNPNSYIEPMADTYGTFVIETGSIEDINTPLYPFHRSDEPNDWWTSGNSRSTREFGYTYPEIQDWGVDQSTLQNNVRTAINNLYNAPARMSPAAHNKRDILHDLENVPHDLTSMAANKVTGQMTKSQFDRLGVNNMVKNWAINVAVDKHALNGNPFQIHFFYGEPDTELKPTEYFKAQNLIGTYRTFTSPMSSSSSSHRRSSDEVSKLSTGQISLSPLLANAAAAGILPDNTLAPVDVVPALSDNLQWRITDSTGENEIPVQELADNGKLRVSVVSRDVEPILAGEEHLFPRYGEWVEWEDVTRGKVGGV
ncbi:tyrosinase [Talaromyces stipitatus ATCC 10500]|uniref:tyrosinase n=1 Tax=Talaromyces stipitatus (strain ATCC 10500 / CBS 375.48 / QM 6759 / NRRL 1006) TaxID=441959 RepID=B8MQC5_TALSN|nr:tyrosinase [Talaromyces stipitatus ATCC 10500]EED13327.1 tyrosinase [Talaromyces stipitatus ATCC 10500]